jgi:PAS domain S-box-containing protein
MDPELTVLLLEDDLVTAELERRAMTRAGLTVRAASTVASATKLLREGPFDAVVSDYNLPDGEPWPLLQAANQQIPRVPVILVTSMGSEKVAAEALHRGVHDYVKKADGFWSELPAAVRRVVRAAAAQRTLQMSDKLFQLIAGNLSDIIIAANLRGEITYISPACHLILGYEPHELKALLNLNLVHPDDHELMTNALKATRLHGQSTATFRCRTRNGEYRWIESNLNSLSQPSAEIPELIVISRDVTDRKNAEIEITKLNTTLEGRLSDLQRAGEALVAARQHAENASRAKSDFLAAMSHEIRTPMNAILGMSDLLRETELDMVQGEYVDRCRRAGASLLTLINDILDLSKIESGRFDLEQIPFDLEDVVEDTVEMMASRAHLKGVGLFATIAPDTPLKLIGDPTRLQQVLVNLLGNAVKFTQRGEIVLNVQPGNSHSSAVHLRFEVSDTGIGIPTDKLDAIFEDFTQADSSTTRRFGGTGLGLGIARRLVECMGGSLTVSSIVDEGSTFTFDAHLLIDPAPVTVPLPKHAKDLIGQRVLIVDDNHTNRLILSSMCSGWGMIPAEATCAADAEAALQSAKRDGRPFSLAILDVLMPGVGGFETLRQIRTIDLHLPVIMMTSNNQPGDATKARSLGASAFATKPIRRNELLRLLTAAMASLNDNSIAPSAEAASSVANGKPPRKMEILVAEDSEDNRFLLRAYLAGRKYDVKFVENGLDALNTFQTRKFDLVLMDILMPVMDGLTATRMMRSFEQQNNRPPTPILALTANALLGHADESRDAGCDFHLSKPISKEQLVAAVDNFLQ